MKRSWMMQQEQRSAAARAAAAGSPAADNAATPASATNAPTPASSATGPAPATAPTATGAPPPGQMIGPNGQLVPQPRHPWDYVDEIILTQKTAWPLLTLSMEYFCDAIQTRFKPSPDEDIYRLVTALLNDAVGQYVHRAILPDDDGSLPQATATNVARVAANLQPGTLHTSFQEDFVTSRPNLAEYVRKLMVWRDRCERLLDRKPKRLSLESATHWLVEYQYNKFDELEVPGQCASAVRRARLIAQTCCTRTATRRLSRSPTSRTASSLPARLRRASAGCASSGMTAPSRASG